MFFDPDLPPLETEIGDLNSEKEVSEEVTLEKISTQNGPPKKNNKIIVKK